MIPALVARLLSTSALAGTRGSLTLLGLALAARFDLLSAPQAWMVSDVGIGLLLALVIVEELAEQDEDLQAVFDLFAYALRGGAGALAGATIQTSASELSGGTIALPEWAAALIGAGVATATHHLRAQLHTQLQGIGDSVLSPRTWLAWLELGGVAGLLVAVVFAPAIALTFVLLASATGLAVLFGKRAAEQRLFRRSCPSCGCRARVEAGRCPGCKGPLGVQRWLG
jgi:hypothetical protein